jgi:hypothetical protein
MERARTHLIGLSLLGLVAVAFLNLNFPQGGNTIVRTGGFPFTFAIWEWDELVSIHPAALAVDAALGGIAITLLILAARSRSAALDRNGPTS